ncbi:MAG: response regulator transcription factor [Opitutales bacterium]
MNTHTNLLEPVTPLSKREGQVLNLLSEGFIRKEISDRLNIAETTVDYHMKHIYRKLRAKNAPAAVGQAYRSGIL